MMWKPKNTEMLDEMLKEAEKLENENKTVEALTQYQKVADEVIADFYSTHEELTDDLMKNEYVKKCDEAFMRLGDVIVKLQKETVKKNPVGTLKYNGFIFVSACCEKMKKTIASKTKNVAIDYDCGCGCTHLVIFSDDDLFTEHYDKCPFCGAEITYEEVE